MGVRSTYSLCHLFKDALHHVGTVSPKLAAMTVVTIILLSTFSPAAGGGVPSATEYQVKAAFLYNFTKFVEWPGDATSGPTLCVGVLGKDPFGEAIEGLKGKMAKGRKIKVMRFRRAEEAKDCDLLFVSASEKGHLTQILKNLQNSRALTVADQEGFCEAGGMINLVPVGNKVGFEVNVAAASRSRVRMSSHLLKLANKIFE